MPPPTRPPQPPVIEMLDVTVASPRASGVPTVTGINWTVAAGEFWVVGGLQGSGKSDLLAITARLATPASGACRLFGHEGMPSHQHERWSERQRVGLVFGEGGRLFNRLTARENVALPLNYHQPFSAAAIDERVAALLEALELSEWAHCTPSMLSLVWRQRVALARALALKPEVLLLDNPLTVLDPRHTRWWVDFLSQLSAGHPLLDGRPATVIVAGDDFRPWRRPGHKFALLEDGCFIPLADPFGASAHQYPHLRELTASEPR